jgi:HAD superfamily hydrolase (TIGR01450 family)
MPPAAAATTAAPPATTTTTIPTIASPSDAATALAQVDTLLFDQDGVLWRGDEDVPGAARALQSLAASACPSSSSDANNDEKRRRLFFVTNNSTLSRRAYASKLTKRLGGLEVTPQQVVCSAWSAAEYLRSKGFGRGGERSGQKVLALGEAGLFDELTEAGIAYTRGPVLSVGEEEEGGKNGSSSPSSSSLRLSSLRCTSADIASFALDPSVGGVVIGWSAQQFTYAWVAYAAACLRELPLCDTFVVTNRDSADALPSGRLLPGTGAIAAAVEAAAGKAHVAVDAGKGGEWLLRGLLPRAIPDFDPSRAAMVGDRLDTDVAFAVEGGFRAAMLTLTGVAKRDEAEGAALAQRPTHILPSVADLTLDNGS